MSERIHEWFECPACGGVSYVIWDPGQSERLLPCSGCARDEHVEHLVLSDGTTHRLEPGVTAPADVLSRTKPSLRRIGQDGRLAPVTIRRPEPIGNRRLVIRGAGHDEAFAWSTWGRVREGSTAAESATQFGARKG